MDVLDQSAESIGFSEPETKRRLDNICREVDRLAAGSNMSRKDIVEYIVSKLD